MAKLILRVPDGAETEISLDDRDSVTIGRSPECDMPITDGQASRRHASVVRKGDGFEVSDLGSTNGTLLNDVQMKTKVLGHGDIIKIGATEIVYHDPDAAPVAGAGEPGACSLVYAKGPRKGQKIELGGQRTTIGRKESNTVPIKDTVASSYHCEVVRDLNGYTIRDLGSTNGTLVNNEMVTEAQLVHGARIRIGNTRFVFQDPAMAEIDLELAGVDDDEAEWGMMRDIDLASVRKRNPASIVYSILFLGIIGALVWLSTQKRNQGTKGGPTAPENNLHAPYAFARDSSALDWEAGEPGSVDVSWAKSGDGGVLSLRATGEDGGDALYVEQIDARNRLFRLTAKAGASGGDCRLGLRFKGAGLQQWALSDPLGGGMAAHELEFSAPPWAHSVEIGVRLAAGATARVDELVLVPAGPARIDELAQGTFTAVSIDDGRQFELYYAGVPTLARGRLVAYDAGGGELPSTGLTSSAKTEGDELIVVTVSSTGGAAVVGVEFTEVNGFLTQGGWRAFTPDQTPDFHASFPDKGELRLEGVRKILVGDKARAFSVTSAQADGRFSTRATADPEGNRWTILGAPGESGFSFKIRTNLRGEVALAREAFATALQLHTGKRWGEFLEAGQSAMAEFPFASATSKQRLSERMGEVTADRAQLVREARLQLADFDEFRDMESLDRVRDALTALRERHQVTSGEGAAGKTYAELETAEQERRMAASRAQETKVAAPIFELAEVNLASEETYAATVLLSYIVNNLPYSEQAEKAKQTLEEIEKDRPQILKVLRDVGIGGR